jgi:hypothetical protein
LDVSRTGKHCRLRWWLRLTVARSSSAKAPNGFGSSSASDRSDWSNFGLGRDVDLLRCQSDHNFQSNWTPKQ